MVIKKKVQNSQEQYQEWLKYNPIKKLSFQEQEYLDSEIQQKIIKELKITSDLGIREFMLKHKWQEIKEFVKTHDKDTIQEVYDLMWRPVGRSDFRRIVPELILISDTHQIRKKNIWNEESNITYDRDEKLAKHWDILRVFISSSRHDGTIGRQLRYLVRDKSTRKYLGIICISSAMMLLTDRDKEVFGDDKLAQQKAWKVGGSGTKNMANGQTIMCTQPFGSTFNGGKLLALLCLSDQITKDWETRYGDKLVYIETTSLFGEKANSQYDGLRPFWLKCGKTTGDTPIKPTDELWKELRRWLKKRYPQLYFSQIKELNEKGQPKVRQKKNDTISKCYSLLKIKKMINIVSGHTRGIYLSRLYKNTDLFLREKIKEKDLIPAFNNSVEFLTEFWRFGYTGDTKEYIHPEIQLLFKKEYRLEKTSSAKKRLQTLINRFDENKANNQQEKELSYHIKSDYDWYAPMAELNWKQVKERYLA